MDNLKIRYVNSAIGNRINTAQSSTVKMMLHHLKVLDGAKFILFSMAEFTEMCCSQCSTWEQQISDMLW